jgi:hypothetical protein
MTTTTDTTTTDTGPEIPSGAPEPDSAVEGTAENDDAAQDADDGKAAKLRKRAQKAEAERDQLAGTLARTRRMIVDAALIARGFDSERLRTAAGVDVETVLTDDGTIDAAKLSTVIEAAAADLGVKEPSRRPLPLPVAGRGGGDRPEPDGLAQFREAFGAKR